MYKKINTPVLFICIFLSSLTQCGSGSKLGNSKFLEGYIIVNNMFYEGVDDKGDAKKQIQGNDSTFYDVNRRIYILNNSLVDIQTSKHFENNLFVRTDTVGVNYFNIDKQEYIKFDKLSTKAKVLRKGKMNESAGLYSNEIDYDPFNEIPDSNWRVRDTLINGIQSLLIEFNESADIDSALASKTKFWINPNIKNFPLQLSYFLSKKNNSGFVYKMQLAMPGEEAVMITSLKYQECKLTDSLKTIFRDWGRKLLN